MRNVVAVIGCLGSVAAMWSGCTGTKATELVPGVSTQIQVPRNLKSVRFDIQAQGNPLCYVYDVDPSKGGAVDLPRTLGVENQQGGYHVVNITLTGYAQSIQENAAISDCLLSPLAQDSKARPRILRRARLGYLNSRILYLPMPLRFSCYDKVDCTDTQTCVAGECVDAKVDETSLLDFANSFIDGVDSTCFSPKVCLPEPAIPAKTVDEDTCTYTFATDPPVGLTGLNVKLFYTGGEAEILDEDPLEGFQRIDAKTFKLAPGLCKIKKGLVPGKEITNINLGATCDPKSVLRPICKPELATLPNLPDGGFSTDGFCNTVTALQPAPSALYVLMDDSASMAQAYGPDGLNQILGFNLTDPAFKSTRVAFQRLTHDAGLTCTDPNSNFAAVPEVAFDLAPKTQTKVGNIVGDPASAKSADLPFFIDGALRGNGAFKAIKDLNLGSAYNRRAVLIIANRRVGATVPGTATKLEGASCNVAGLDATQLAKNAKDVDGIYTYFIMLKNPDGKPVMDEAKLIATKSTDCPHCFSDLTNGSGEEAAKAFKNIVADLGACFYEIPASMKIDSGKKVAYFNPVTANETTVPFDATCNEGTQTSANGWNIEGARMRVCGATCTTLRDTMVNASLLAKANNQPAPEVSPYVVCAK